MTDNLLHRTLAPGGRAAVSNLYRNGNVTILAGPLAIRPRAVG